MQWITGFCNLQRHKHKKDPNTDPLCRLCREEDETPEHLSWHCPGLLWNRREHLGVQEGWNPEWRPREVLRFIRHSVCKELLVDQENYGREEETSSTEGETTNGW